MQLIKLYICFVEKLSEITGLIVSVLMPAMVIVLTYEVIARYVFERPTIWVYDTAIFMFGYIGILSGAYVMKHKEHINVDMVYNMLSPRGQAILRSITGFIFFFFIILVIYYGWKAGIDSFLNDERRPTEWAPPLGHFKLVIPAGALLLFLQGLADWIRSVYRALTDKELDI